MVAVRRSRSPGAERRWSPSLIRVSSTSAPSSRSTSATAWRQGTSGSRMPCRMRTGQPGSKGWPSSLAVFYPARTCAIPTSLAPSSAHSSPGGADVELTLMKEGDRRISSPGEGGGEGGRGGRGRGEWGGGGGSVETITATFATLVRFGRDSRIERKGGGKRGGGGGAGGGSRYTATSLRSRRCLWRPELRGPRL